MLEALIAIGPDAGEKRQGDIIIAKPVGSAWCDEEQRTLQLITYRDDALEADIMGRPGRMISYPYADYDKDGNRIKRSTVRVKIDNLEDSAKIKDPSIRVGLKTPVDPSDLIIDTPKGTGRTRKTRGVA